MDDTDNGQHLVPANKFIPPSLKQHEQHEEEENEEDFDVMEEDPAEEPESKKQSTNQDSALSDKKLDEETKSKDEERSITPVKQIMQESSTTTTTTTTTSAEQKPAEEVAEMTPPAPKDKHLSLPRDLGSSEDGEVSPGLSFPNKASSESKPTEDSNSTPADESAAPLDKPRAPSPKEVTNKEIEKIAPPIDKPDEAPEAPALTSKPSLTIRISNLTKSDDKAAEALSTKKKRPVIEDEESSDEEELFADTPVTQRKVKSIDLERIGSRKRSASDDASTEAPPSKRRIVVKIKKEREVAALESFEESKNLAETKEDSQGSPRPFVFADSEGATGALSSFAKSERVDESPKNESKMTISINLNRTADDIDEEDLMIPSATTPKGKKGDRASSPIPRGRKSPMDIQCSPVARSGPSSPTEQDVPEGESKSTMKPVSKHSPKPDADLVDAEMSTPTSNRPLVGSKNSAFARTQNSPKEGKDILDLQAPNLESIGQEDSEEPKPLSRAASRASTESLPSVRSGRRAAQQAKEKLNSKQEKEDETVPESGKKKKKRKRKEGSDGDNESDPEDEMQWVRCDKCEKWRVIPPVLKKSSLPKHWYCHLNVHDPKRSSCSAPEQSAKQAVKEYKRAKKRARKLREQAELENMPDDSKQGLGKGSRPSTPTTSQKPASPMPEKGEKSPKPTKGVLSPKGPKKVLSSRKLAAASEDSTKRSSPTATEDNSQDSGSDSQQKVEKKAKKGRPPSQPQTAETNADEKEAEPKKPGRRRGRPARNANRDAQEKKDDDNVEWVQCEKCEKWRKLPTHITADELPDTWYCSMNTWNPGSASCESPEDKADALHQEVGGFGGNMPQGVVGKFSYRSMIFGNGRKHNRPMSERTRAAESLFMREIDDDENPHPTVMYSKSSAFLPRVSNFTKSQSVEEKGLGIFDVLSNSDLFGELRGIGAPMPVLSTNVHEQSFPKFLTFENLPENIKLVIREGVLICLGSNILSADDIVLDAQHFPWDSLSRDLVEIQAFINADIIINTILSLVRDGLVEMTCLRDPYLPISEWTPKYRRVRSRRDIESEETPKASRCMKIAKPWKQREGNSTDWITGRAAFA